MARKVMRIAVGMVILGLGVGAFLLLKSARKPPARKTAGSGVVAVTVTRALPARERATVEASGSVVPARSVTLLPEVGGRVVWQNPRLTVGGRLKAGEALIRVDARDYDIAVRQAGAAVSKAKADLATVKAQAQVAKRELELTAPALRPTGEALRLALKEIALETAQAALDSAKSGLDKARLARSRTTVSAPFDSVVIDESVELGQLVGPSSRIATLVDSSLFWVRVALPVDRLAWVRIPGIAGTPTEEASGAVVRQQVGVDVTTERRGQVVRLLGDVDPKGRMARLLVEVDDPLDALAGDSARIPLLLGSYATVDIEGPALDGLIALPRVALRDDDRIWVVEDGKLQVRSVKTVWTREETLFVEGDLKAGDQVITSRVDSAVDGMAVRILEEKPPEAPSSSPPLAQDRPTGAPAAPAADSRASPKPRTPAPAAGSGEQQL